MDKQLLHAMEIQSLAQAGLAYTNNAYDIERYRRLGKGELNSCGLKRQIFRNNALKCSPIQQKD